MKQHKGFAEAVDHFTWHRQHVLLGVISCGQPALIDMAGINANWVNCVLEQIKAQVLSVAISCI